MQVNQGGILDAAGREGALSYRSSGRIAWMHFLPLAIVGLIASGILARVMAEYEAIVYYLLLTPALLGLPLLGLLELAIRRIA